MVYLPNGGGKWQSWSQYINKLRLEIKSLQDYLNYFNPDYYIINDKLEGSEGPTKTDQNYKKNIVIKYKDSKTNESGYIVRPQWLSFRQGYYNESGTNVWIDYSGIYKSIRVDDSYELEVDAERDIHNVMSLFPPSSTIFSAKWTHSGEDNYLNEERSSINAYRILSRTEPVFYVVEGAQNSLVTRLYKNGLSTIGSSIFFCIDNFPTRYILKSYTDKNGDTQDPSNWEDSGSEGVSWSCEAAFWESESSEPILKIADKQGKVWLNSYPLMHKLHIIDENNVHETFITDDVWQVEKTNIANHTTTRYTIKVENLENESANFAGLKVKTLII